MYVGQISHKLDLIHDLNDLFVDRMIQITIGVRIPYLEVLYPGCQRLPVGLPCQLLVGVVLAARLEDHVQLEGEFGVHLNVTRKQCE